MPAAGCYRTSAMKSMWMVQWMVQWNVAPEEGGGDEGQGGTVSIWCPIENGVDLPWGTLLWVLLRCSDHTRESLRGSA